MSKSSGDFSSLAVGYAAVVRISTASASAALCAALGYWGDGRLDTAPWGTIVGALLGAAAFCVGLVATAKRLERESESLSGETRIRREGQVPDLDAVISVETSKTEALRGEFEETLARAATLTMLKSKKTITSDDAANGSDANKAERFQ